MADVVFRPDLYWGAADDYERFRLAYPPELIDDLAQRSGARGRGMLLDLACGTGQAGFALRPWFARVWAVDQEPDMIRVARQRARAAGLRGITFVTSPAERLSAPPGSFDLVAIGNAFHRLPRDLIAARSFGWLRQGGWLALLWSGSPWNGEQPWQQAVAEAMSRWRGRLADGDRIPAGYERAREERPDSAVLRAAGFQPEGRRQFARVHEWTPEAVVGFLYSTSVLSRAALGRLADEFEADLLGELRRHQQAGPLRQTISYAYDLARRPWKAGSHAN